MLVVGGGVWGKSWFEGCRTPVCRGSVGGLRESKKFKIIQLDNFKIVQKFKIIPNFGKILLSLSACIQGIRRSNPNLRIRVAFFTLLCNCYPLIFQL